MNDAIEHEGKEHVRLSGTHDTRASAEERAKRIRRKRRKVSVLVRETTVFGKDCFAVYVDKEHVGR